jgi:hypothetical protein
LHQFALKSAKITMQTDKIFLCHFGHVYPNLENCSFMPVSVCDGTEGKGAGFGPKSWQTVSEDLDQKTIVPDPEHCRNKKETNSPAFYVKP